MDAAVPAIEFPADLPISDWADEIVAAVSTHRVIVVAGETGSGKTTQLPKMCLLAGRKAIGHTQPRRIAARSIATRIAAEMGTELGDVVGYQVRFHKQAGKRTRLKVMTDGILLAEIAQDRDLRRYDTIIVDEAHERSLNIDFLLGYLKQLLVRRSDLRVIVTSATIDTARFSEHFDGAPIIEVSGRTYPVEVRYRPLTDADDPDQVDGICRAVTELQAESPGDILVFCSGEREIRDAAEGLAALGLPHTEVLPLYARLSVAEQDRVFTRSSGRRIVLATNVAETSITVPGIRYVVDAGTARISRYSARTKVQRLPIEPISQASAAQRAGRCGRLGPGICIRLYSEEDFAGRPQFTDPEIVRTNLAAVMLQMAVADLGDIASFPFVEAPEGTQVTDGVRLLRELGALADKAQRTRRGSPVLTPVGRQLAALPVDPRLGRMLLAAADLDCLREVLPIVGGLAIPDVRERPAAAQDKADAAHRRFWTAPPGGAAESSEASDILALLRLWQYIRVKQRELSGNGFRRLCRDEYLSFLRIREWQDLNAQLKQSCRDLGLARNEQPAGSDAIHTAVLAGLLSHVGLLDERVAPPQDRRRRPLREYMGARGARFAINPGSSVSRITPDLVMAVELVETSRLWARTVAGIRSEWIEQVGDHLLQRRYSEPHWSQRAGNVLATQTVSLYGVPVISGREIVYGRIDPVAARDLFIQGALVEGRWATRHQFFHRNEAVRREVEGLEDRARRRDILVSDQVLFDFYDARIPAGVFSVTHFDTWWRVQRRDNPQYLDLSLDDLVATEVDPAAYPDVWTVGELDLPVSYVFDPGSGHDGVSVAVELARLNQVSEEQFSWHVPGLREELAVELIRSLPKPVRTSLVPAPDHARKALVWLADHPVTAPESLQQGLSRALLALTGVRVDPGDWSAERLPPHLRVKYRVVDGDSEVAVGTDLDQLRTELAQDTTATLTQNAPDISRSGCRTWDFGTLPQRLDMPGISLVGYPGLVDEGGSVGVSVFDSPERSATSHAAGLRRLVALMTPDPTKWVVGHLSNAVKLGLGASPYRSVPELLADCRLKAVGDLVSSLAKPSEIRDQDAFHALCTGVRQQAPTRMQAVVDQTARVLNSVRGVESQLALTPAGDAAVDVREQLRNLVFPGFVAATPPPHDGHIVRYLEGMQRRLVAARANPARDAQLLDQVLEVEAAYAELCEVQPPGPLPVPVADIGWQIEELRVSLFAQALGTSRSVSVKRIMRAIAELKR